VPDAPRVLLVVANGGHGGMQVQVGLLAGGLRARGCVVAVAAGPGDLDTAGASVERLSEMSARSAPRVVLELRGVVRRFAPDVVHGHGLRLAPMLAAVARKRALVTCHGLDPARVRATSLATRLSRVAVASCGEGPRRLLAERGVVSRVLDNAVPVMPAPVARDELLARFGLPASMALAVSPARLTEQKDPLTLVRALAAAKGVCGLLVGGGPLDGAIRAEVARLGAEDRIVIAPWQPDARALLAGADLLVLASRWEGQPTVVLEAMAAGVAVVATSCPGIADTVVDGRSALLAAPGDHAALAAQLERAASDPGLRRSLVDLARTQANRHRVEVVVEEHLDAYARLREGRWP